jgi:hypothetical protein
LNQGMDDEPRRGPGALILGLGVAMLVLVFLARALDWRLPPSLGFLDDNLFLPIILVLVGRGMLRSSRRPRPTTVAMPRQSGPSAPQPRPRRVELPPSRYEAPDAAETTASPAPLPVTPAPAPTPAPARPTQHVPPRPVTEPARPIAVPKPAPEGHGKTSKEMIAEAKRRLGERKG